MVPAQDFGASIQSADDGANTTVGWSFTSFVVESEVSRLG
jgi:hypothetical protein